MTWRLQHPALQPRPRPCVLVGMVMGHRLASTAASAHHHIDKPTEMFVDCDV